MDTPEHEEELYCAGDSALEEIVQRACGVSLTADTQEPSAHNSLLWDDPVLAVI